MSQQYTIVSWTSVFGYPGVLVQKAEGVEATFLFADHYPPPGAKPKRFRFTLVETSFGVLTNKQRGASYNCHLLRDQPSPTYSWRLKREPTRSDPYVVLHDADGRVYRALPNFALCTSQDWQWQPLTNLGVAWVKFFGPDSYSKFILVNDKGEYLLVESQPS